MNANEDYRYEDASNIIMQAVKMQESDEMTIDQRDEAVRASVYYGYVLD